MAWGKPWPHHFNKIDMTKFIEFIHHNNAAVEDFASSVDDHDTDLEDFAGSVDDHDAGLEDFTGSVDDHDASLEDSTSSVDDYDASLEDFAGLVDDHDALPEGPHVARSVFNRVDSSLPDMSQVPSASVFEYKCLTDIKKLRHNLGYSHADSDALVVRRDYELLRKAMEEGHLKGIRAFVVTGHPGIGSYES